MELKKQIREIKVVDLLTYTLLPPILIVLLWTLVTPLAVKYIPIRGWVVYVISGIVTYYLTKRFAIGVVLAYKAFAPLKVRARCRFTPTCSTYMIMSIKKYGLVFGVIKGIRRVMRCKPPNGGVDYP